MILYLFIKALKITNYVSWESSEHEHYCFFSGLCLFWPPKYRHPAWSDYTLYVSQIVRPIHIGIKPIDMLISKFSKIFSPKTSPLIPCLVPSLKNVTERPLNVKELIGHLSLKGRDF